MLHIANRASPAPGAASLILVKEVQVNEANTSRDVSFLLKVSGPILNTFYPLERAAQDAIGSFYSSCFPEPSVASDPSLATLPHTRDNGLIPKFLLPKVPWTNDTCRFKSDVTQSLGRLTRSRIRLAGSSGL
jgi:hypothetical protein